MFEAAKIVGGLIVAAIILNRLNKLIMTNQEAVDKINALTAQVEKVRTEVQALIDAAQNQGEVSPELAAAIEKAQVALQGVDDLNADAPTGEPGE